MWEKTCLNLANRVTLSDQKDQYGMRAPNVHFSDHKNDIAMRNHAFGRGKAIYDAVGATKTIETPPYPSTHNLGTNRMSAKASDGVVNKYSDNHGILKIYLYPMVVSSQQVLRKILH